MDSNAILDELDKGDDDDVDVSFSGDSSYVPSESDTSENVEMVVISDEEECPSNSVPVAESSTSAAKASSVTGEIIGDEDELQEPFPDSDESDVTETVGKHYKQKKIKGRAELCVKIRKVSSL